MAAGIWTCPKRVERDGYLVAYEGERMTMADAKRRGLLEEPAEEPAEEKPAAKKPAKKPAKAATKKKATK